MGAQKRTPKASPKKKSTTLQHLFDIDSNKSSSNNNTQSPHDDEAEEILSLISYCTFTDSEESPSQQDLKRLKLMQLLSILKSSQEPFEDTSILSPLISMISSNLFRPLPPTSNPCILPEDDEDAVFSPSVEWPHLHVVYDILLKLVLTIDPTTLRNYVDHAFLLNLLALFQSEDRRERESLKNVYHRIYSKFTFYRSFMRKATKDVFLHFAFETERHCGIGELLEIWGSIINGFGVPLKEEHKLFLMRVLVPLHKPKGMQVYHRQLTYCVSQFVQKEPMLGGVVVMGVLRYWPLTNCQKEVLFIGEMEEIVEYTDPMQFEKLALPLCSQIARCLSSWNSQVSERALYLWNNEHFVKMASQSIEQVLPSMVEGLEKNIQWHWSKTIRQLSANVKTMLEEMEPKLYSKSLEDIDQRESMADQEEKRKEKWERLEIMAAAKNQLLQQQHCIAVSN